MIYGLWSEHFLRWMVNQIGGIWTSETKCVALAQLLCEQKGLVDKKAAAGRENNNRIAQYNAARQKKTNLALPKGGFIVPGHDGQPVQMAQQPVAGDGPPLVRVTDPQWVVAEIGKDGLPKGVKEKEPAVQSAS